MNDHLEETMYAKTSHVDPDEHKWSMVLSPMNILVIPLYLSDVIFSWILLSDEHMLMMTTSYSRINIFVLFFFSLFILFSNIHIYIYVYICLRLRWVLSFICCCCWFFLHSLCVRACVCTRKNNIIRSKLERNVSSERISYFIYFRLLSN